MKVRQLPYVDWNSPGMIDPDRAERDDEGLLEDIEIDDDAPPEILEYAREQGYRPAHPRVLPPERFSDARATPEQCGMVNAPTGPDDTGPKSKTIRMRLACSCAGWKRPPTSDEFYEAVRAEKPDKRQWAIWTAGAARPRTSRYWTPGPSTPTRSASWPRRSNGPASDGARLPRH